MPNKSVPVPFRTLVFILAVLWLVFAFIAIVLSFFSLNQNQQQVFAYGLDGWKYLTGAIVGLVVGQRLD